MLRARAAPSFALMQTVRAAVFDLLRRHDITRIFGNPGSTELPMFTDFPSDFDYVGALQEAIALSMADGFAQATGGPALVNLHSAVGLGHAMGALFTAFRNRTPLIVTAGQQSRALLLHDPFLMANRPTELPRPYVKWACEPARAADVPQAFAKAIAIAMTPPRGPVFLSIPAEDWDETVESAAYRPPPPAIGPDPGTARTIGDALSAARNPALIVGGEVDRDRAWKEVRALAEALGAPVYQPSMEGRIGFAQNHELFAGMIPPDPASMSAMLGGHDAILVLGARVATLHVDGPRPYLPPDARIFQISSDPETLASAPVGEAMLASTRLAAMAIATSLGRSARSYYQRAITAPVAGDAITYPLLLAALDRLRDRDSTIVEEAPTLRPHLPDFLPIDRPGRFLTCASGGLGFGLPAAVGVALARPDKRTIALIGDGSAMYAIQALWTAARERANVAVLILNNGRYAALDGFGERYGIADPPGCDLSGLDFIGLAAAQGVPGKHIDQPGDLDEALEAILSDNGPALLDIAID